MSNALAIASVTAVLKDLLDNALIDHSVTQRTGNRVTVTALSPDRIKAAGEKEPQLNLFLYHVMPNQGWRNVELPSRNERGEQITNPPLALDLYYMLTSYGKKDFDAEILLGYGMQILHETPILTRDSIRRSLSTKSPVTDEILEDVLIGLTASELADQVESIKITPHPISTEEISKLWTAFQTNYRPSVAYKASVILIESRRPARSPLPVLTIGRLDPETHKERGVIAQPSLFPPCPSLDEAIPPNGQVSVRMGEILTLRGRHLLGYKITVRFSHLRSSESLELTAEEGATDTEVRVRIPPDPAPNLVAESSPQNPDNWRAGLYSVSVVVSRHNKPDRTTNILPISLAPRIIAKDASLENGDVVLKVSCSPKTWKEQTVNLVIGDQNISAERILAPMRNRTFKFKAPLRPAKGDHPMRLRVDGVDSIFIDRSKKPPEFDPSQKVTIP